jgi:glycosylphosphatidylinositol deacylase
MTRPTSTGILGILSIALSLVFYRAAVDVSYNLSPEGCRMSWMYPSYIPQVNFDSSWTSLASRYSLWLYREADRESDEVW